MAKIYGIKIKKTVDPRPWSAFGVCISFPAGTSEEYVKGIVSRMNRDEPEITAKLVSQNLN